MTYREQAIGTLQMGASAILEHAEEMIPEMKAPAEISVTVTLPVRADHYGWPEVETNIKFVPIDLINKIRGGE